jgi:hypothetical protein
MVALSSIAASSAAGSSAYGYTKAFSSTTSWHATHHFDTQAFAQRLEAAGLSREQTDVLTQSLRDVIDESISNLAKGLVTREEGDQTTYTQKVDFTRLKSELQLLERNDFAVMKSENERLMADVEKLKQRLREEITRTTAGVRLDLNLEKGKLPRRPPPPAPLNPAIGSAFVSTPAVSMSSADRVSPPLSSLRRQAASVTSRLFTRSRSKRSTPASNPRSPACAPASKAPNSTFFR